MGRVSQIFLQCVRLNSPPQTVCNAANAEFLSPVFYRSAVTVAGRDRIRRESQVLAADSVSKIRTRFVHAIRKRLSPICSAVIVRDTRCKILVHRNTGRKKGRKLILNSVIQRSQIAVCLIAVVSDGPGYGQIWCPSSERERSGTNPIDTGCYCHVTYV